MKHHGVAVADAPFARAGDFLLGDVAIHVTTAPGEALIRKCQGNLSSGLRPLVVTTEDGVGGARALAKQAAVDERVDVIEIEQFIATNVYEWSTFAKGGRPTAVREIIDRYNRIIGECETIRVFASNLKMTPDEARSRMMRAVKSTDTKPEITVRRLTHALGFRYRLHRKASRPPDLVFSKKRKVIFVHGCFWHGHDCVRGARVPRNNRSYWLGKIAGNRARDTKSLALLAVLGWEVLVIWECEPQKPRAVSTRILRFLGAQPRKNAAERQQTLCSQQN